MSAPAAVRDFLRAKRALYALQRAAREFAAKQTRAAELAARGPEDDAALEPALAAFDDLRRASEKLEAAALAFAELAPPPRRSRRRRR